MASPSSAAPTAARGPTTYQAKVVESGTVRGVTLRWTLGGVSGSAAMSGSGSAWSGRVPLNIDSGTVTAVATDGAGNQGTSNSLALQGNCLR